MPDFSDIYARDDAIFEVLQEIRIPDALKCFKKNNFPNTGQVMTTFVTKINFIKTAIFSLCESDNLYATNIVFRSLIEHFLKAQYIFMKWAEDKNDNVGENYNKWYQASELYDYAKSWEAVSKLVNNCKSNVVIEEELYEFWPDLKEKNIKDIKRVADQFKYRSIIKYIHEKVPNHSKSIEESFLLKIIPRYAELSGFVHGGPSADKEIMSLIDNHERENKLIEIADLTVDMTASINRYLIIMLMNIDRSYEKILFKLRKYYGNVG